MTLDRLLPVARQVLNIPRIDPDRSFLDLGGDSLGAIRMARLLQDALGTDIDALDVIECPSLRTLGDVLAVRHGRPAPPPPVLPLPGRPSYPASPVQAGLFLLDRMTDDDEAVTLPTLFFYGAALDPGFAERAFRAVLVRHEILRTTFGLSEGRVVQVVHEPADPPAGFGLTDATAGEDRPDEVLAKAYEAALTTRLVPETGPLVRLHLVVVSPTETIGLLTLHHIVSDDYTAAIVDADFRQAYDHAAQRPLLAPGLAARKELPHQYKDYAGWLRDWCEGPEAQEALRHWAGVLPARPEGCVFRDADPAGFGAARVDLALEARVRDLLARMGTVHSTTMFVTLASCIRVLILLRFAAPDALLGVAMATGKAGLDDEHIGPYVNTLPVAAPITAATTFRQLVAAVGEATREAFAHRALPVEVLSEHVPGTGPLFDVGFTLQRRDRQPRRTDLSFLEDHERADPLGIQLLFAAFEEPDRLSLRVRYRTVSFRREEITSLLGQLVRVIEAVSLSPDVPLDTLPVPAGEWSAGRRHPDLELDLGPGA